MSQEDSPNRSTSFPASPTKFPSPSLLASDLLDGQAIPKAVKPSDAITTSLTLTGMPVNDGSTIASSIITNVAISGSLTSEGHSLGLDRIAGPTGDEEMDTSNHPLVVPSAGPTDSVDIIDIKASLQTPPCSQVSTIGQPTPESSGALTIQARGEIKLTNRQSGGMEQVIPFSPKLQDPLIPSLPLDGNIFTGDQTAWPKDKLTEQRLEEAQTQSRPAETVEAKFEAESKLSFLEAPDMMMNRNHLKVVIEQLEGSIMKRMEEEASK
ncbi:unnamed protein product [Protopolystoma xenopodis]|uniref:Uncharacterized protein n=1 Tax=Protopolystoma xenopodis TaxID=117903 RepID=A0A448WJX4_9PLAT|nr:unnamed protein product [Protopolystoma xenopodis]